MSKAIASQGTVKFAGKEVLIKKMNLRKIATVLKVVEDFPNEFLNEGGKIDNADFIKQLPKLIVEILPKYADIAAGILDNQITGDEIQEADYDEIFDLVEEFLQVNNIPAVMARAGKVKALVSGKEAGAVTG